MVGIARLAPAAALLVAMSGCRAAAESPREPGVGPDTVAAAPDSIPEERPDSVKSTPPDSTTMVLALLPAAPGLPLGSDAAAMGERAVFVPRTQRWFMVRRIDSIPSMDIGRIDGGVGTTDAARAAFDRMLASSSPIQPGMQVTMHPGSGAVLATVTGLRLSGRRILALLDAPGVAADESAAPTEWRGTPPLPRRPAVSASCAPGDTAAISAAIARYVPDPKTETLSVIRGCFGDFRALIAIRPLEITPESVERVVLVRATGKTRSGRLRDLSYPLHQLLGTTDVDGDGRHEIIVRSYRPAMETWAALRMTDSVSFTRFASGFTIEKR